MNDTGMYSINIIHIASNIITGAYIASDFPVAIGENNIIFVQYATTI